MATGLLAGCGVKEKIRGDNNRVAFDGIYFKSHLTADKADNMAFAVTVAGASQNIAAAREAGRYEATKYCVNNFGNSEVDWTAGPDAPLGALVISDDTLNLAGRCRG
ncbi:hypothetical protein GR167_04325 [Rhodobacteraceae bacterium GS-10]|uniref:Uncharacterized protein n=1 Tax=Thalassovita mangrovi TaxID=2692236 RepID=A0A6L8LF27_9RHOB|nr:hypothetical protein [Thalassovita mangrovi]